MGEINPPNIDGILGMEVYKSKTPGIGGKIKEIPEDFIVEEITPKGEVLEVDKESKIKIEEGLEYGGYTYLTLQKRNWSTLRAIRELSKRLRISRRRIGFAGTKDKRALTTQRISIWKKSIDDIKNISLRDIKLKDFGYSDRRINLGDLKGNRFIIVIRDIELSKEEIKYRLDRINNELRSGFPNFFGVQRFGTKRPITHIVGREIVKGNIKNAVMTYLTKYFEGESSEVINARIFLRETEDFEEAIKRFPMHLEYEHSILNYLIKNRNDFKGALRQLPVELGKMFVHAYQSFIFNKALSFYIKEEIEVEKLPLVGYKSKIDEVTSKIIEDEGVSKDDFRIREMPEMSSRGGIRDSFVVPDDFHIVEISSDNLNQNKNMLKIKFSLPKGSYATSLLREFMKI